MENMLLIAIFGVVTLGLAVWIFMLHRRLSVFISGKDGGSLEKTIHKNQSSITDLENQVRNNYTSIEHLSDVFNNSIQHVGIVRFNPFKETGGNQSFALAFLDHHKNGMVISSLYARERMNVFAKAVSNGTSEHKLTEEEEQAIADALK